ncbi:cytidine deaminase [Ruminococcaceae bacterium YRB3002]|nr:cytidine deaminase [Ruminococcaceae bacterium YRB3002]
MKRIDFYQLADEANKAREMAYAPYSGFTVGAALLTSDEKVYLGCNIENAAYSPSICAERTAFVKAVSDGYNKPADFKAIAIVGGAKGEEPKSKCAPCGVCRQVMNEFTDPESFLVILPDEKGELDVHTLSELLPLGFRL